MVKSLCGNIICVNTFASSHLLSLATTTRMLWKRKNMKHTKCNCQMEHILSKLLAIETTGVYSNKAEAVIKRDRKMSHSDI